MFVILYTYLKQLHTSDRPNQINAVFSTAISKYDLILNYIKPPFPYKRVQDMDKMYSQAKQDQTVYELLPKQNGFFIEMGAFDGITFSNTLWLERNHNWTGLLIEANPDLCDVIDRIQRRVWRLCGCISEKSSVVFIKGGALGSAADTVDVDHLNLLNSELKIVAPCFKLKEILDTIHHVHIDYFSLDVEGGEMSVLNSIKEELKSKTITVDVWTIEYRVIDEKQKIIANKSKQNLEILRNYFTEVGGYVEHSQLSNTLFTSDGMALDVVFITVEAWCKRHLTVPSGVKCSK